MAAIFKGKCFILIAATKRVGLIQVLGPSMHIKGKSMIGALLATFAGMASGKELHAAGVCWPLNFAGITLSVNTDPEVQRLLGKGVLRKDDGDSGGRYYIDQARSATLHVVFVTDSVVGEVTLEQGLSPQLKGSDLLRATSKWFDPKGSFGNWHALHLGSSKQDVVEKLGAPKEGESSNAWEYQSACTCELPQYFTLYFRSGHMYKVVFSAPSG